MRNRPLRDRKILLTRPGGLSDTLHHCIKRAGGSAVYLPSMAIMPMPDSNGPRQLLAGLHHYDVLIFVSRNAVKYAHELAPDLAARVVDKITFAVGVGTGKALRSIGFTDVNYTDSNTGSEALLDMEGLQAANVKGRKVLILRGVGGRQLLGDKLLARGAKVHYVELYQRAMPDVEPADIRHIWLSEKPDVVLVTSAEGLHNLLEMTGEEERPLFLNTRLVVISPRLRDMAESCGFKATIKVAAGFSDDDFMRALVDMFEVNEDE